MQIDPVPTSRAPLLGVIVSGVLATLNCAALILALRMSGIWLIPAFGLLGLTVVLQAFPWLLFLTSVLLIIIFTRLLQRLPHWKSRPFWMLPSLAPVSIVVVGCALAMSISLITREPHREQRLPPNPLLRGYGAWRFHNVFRGTVTEARRAELLMTTPYGDTMLVHLEPGTQFPTGNHFEPGETVLIIGELEGNTIRAFGIRTIPPRSSR